MFVVDKSLCPDADRKYECVPYTLGSLIAWLETRDPAEEYDFNECGDCLIARYSSAQNERLAYHEASDRFTDDAVIAIALHDYCDWNMGAALSRTRKYVAGTP